MYCNFDYQQTVTDFNNTTKNASYDSSTGLLVGLKANGSINQKIYCDGGAKTVTFATLAVAAAFVSMY